jgi:hypothetical protein
MKKNPAAVALGKLGGKAKSEAKTKSSAANGALGGRPKVYLYAVQRYNSDLDAWESKFNAPMSRDEAMSNVKQLRRWAKDEDPAERYRIIKVTLSRA